MRHLNIIPIALSLLLSFGSLSCSDNKDVYDTEDIQFVRENDVLSFQRESNSNNFRIKSAVTPQISCSENWVSLKLERLTASIYRLYVTVDENNGDIEAID